MKYAIIENDNYRGSDAFNKAIYGDKYVLQINDCPMTTAPTMQQLIKLAENPPAYWIVS